MKSLSPARIRAARILAVCADAVQIGLPYLFGEGVLSPLDNVLDVVMCVVLTVLVGWHHVFLPSFILEVFPLVDFAPTWTLATFYATRKGAGQASVSARKVEPPPPALPAPIQAPGNKN